MAYRCINCGSKFSSDGFEVISDRHLCCTCAREVRSDIASLQYAQSYKEYAQLKEKILKISAPRFNDETKEAIAEKMRTVESRFSSEIVAEKESFERSRLEENQRARDSKNKTFFENKANSAEVAGDGYWEYKVVSLLDEAGIFNSTSGTVDVREMTNLLNMLGLEGWRLVTAYSNEVGRNALAGAIGRVGLGVNSTVDENILIFERFIKPQKEN